MLILILVICIGLIICSCVVDDWDLSFGLSVTGIIVGIITLTMLVIVMVCNVDASIIPSKIGILEEQNQQIENQINIIVEDYLDHESETYDKLTPDNAEIFAIAYPQLASNETVKKQMELYIDNNRKITELKLELCYIPTYRWWIYFGK